MKEACAETLGGHIGRCLNLTYNSGQAIVVHLHLSLFCLNSGGTETTSGGTDRQQVLLVTDSRVQSKRPVIIPRVPLRRPVRHAAENSKPRFLQKLFFYLQNVLLSFTGKCRQGRSCPVERSPVSLAAQYLDIAALPAADGQAFEFGLFGNFGKAFLVAFLTACWIIRH